MAGDKATASNSIAPIKDVLSGSPVDYTSGKETADGGISVDLNNPTGDAPVEVLSAKASYSLDGFSQKGEFDCNAPTKDVVADIGHPKFSK